MKTDIPTPDAHQEMREALRALCGSFDSAYWQKIDHERGYPEAFVNALTEAGWLAALIPSEFGGSGLSPLEVCVVAEEIDRAAAPVPFDTEPAPVLERLLSDVLPAVCSFSPSLDDCSLSLPSV